MKRLTSKQKSALAQLAIGRSVEIAAIIAGVQEQTVARWLTRDAFVSKLIEMLYRVSR